MRILLGTIVLAGCASGAATHSHGHSHVAATSPRDVMVPTPAGDHHVALLSAHLAPSGNELDIFIETRDRQPAAIASAPFEATVRIAGEDRTTTFACAPAAERPAGEAAHQCSHFVAAVPWMHPRDTVRVTGWAKAADANVELRWEGFRPFRYAHVHEQGAVATK